MKRLTVGLFVSVALAAGVAVAAKTQVAQGVYRMLTKGAFYGRSDGVAQEVSGKAIVVIENGTESQSIGKGFYEAFTYGDADGLYCRDSLVSNSMACAGNAALIPCTCTTGSGHSFAWLPLLQQDIAPDMDADSLDISGDQTDNDGAMLLWGGVFGSSGKPFVIGHDPAFYMCSTVSVTDITGIDANIMAGFVSMSPDDAFNADFEALDAYAGIGIVGTAAAGVSAEDIVTKTEIDADANGTGDGVVTTDTTDDATEGVAYKYCTHVSGAGVVTYTVNGTAPTTTVSYTFTDGQVVVPFITYLHTNDVAGEIDLTVVEVGYSD